VGGRPRPSTIGTRGAIPLIVVFPVAILTLVPAFGLAADGRAEAPSPVRLTTAATVERIPLPGLRGPLQCTVDSLARVIRLRPTKDTPAALLARIVGRTGTLCPHASVRDGAVELVCRSRRIEAELGRQGKTQYLDINELRGLPWRDGADKAPTFFFDPWRVGLGQTCPGKADAARGECQLKQGHLLEAAGLFRSALTTQHRQMASLRLGDLAVATGDPVTAIGWYHRVGALGVFGQLAASRLCEIEGTCFGSSEAVRRVFDPTGMPEPMRAEISIRAARVEAYLGRMQPAIKIMADQIQAHGVASLCRENAELLCRRILLQAMREAALAPLPPPPSASSDAHDSDDDASTDGDGATAAPGAPAVGETAHLNNLMQIFFALPSWDQGPLAVDLAEGGAAIALRMGAPAFAGNLLATAARDVPDRRLSDHLLLAVEAFVHAHDLVRARVVAEYVEMRLGPKGRSGDRWKAALKAIGSQADEDEVPSELRAEIEKEIAASLDGLKDARAALDKASAVLRGVNDAAASSKAPPVAGPSAKPAAKQGGG
jgi:hypothetical protein